MVVFVLTLDEYTMDRICVCVCVPACMSVFMRVVVVVVVSSPTHVIFQ
jgi:hypothetical protein